MNLDLQKVLPAEAFETEQNEGDYIGKDGLLYCGVCRTKKQTRLPASDFTGGREIIVPCICKCKVEENKRKEEEEKKRQEMQRLERLKASSLMDAKLKAARLDGYQVDGDNQKIYNLAGNYVKRFDEMYEKRQGLLFWGTVGTGKSYTAACIANELLNQMIPVVMTSFVKILQNIQGKLRTAGDVLGASNAVLLQFERPADQSVAVQKKRAAYGQKYYEMMCKGGKGMSNSSLVTCIVKSPNHSGARTHAIDRITPHCVVGQLSASSIGGCFTSPDVKASCNYGIGTEGGICLVVDECNRSWCSSSGANDQRAVTIECASDKAEPYAFNSTV